MPWRLSRALALAAAAATSTSKPYQESGASPTYGQRHICQWSGPKATSDAHVARGMPSQGLTWGGGAPILCSNGTHTKCKSPPPQCPHSHHKRGTRTIGYPRLVVDPGCTDAANHQLYLFQLGRTHHHIVIKGNSPHKDGYCSRHASHLLSPPPPSNNSRVSSTQVTAPQTKDRQASSTTHHATEGQRTHGR